MFLKQLTIQGFKSFAHKTVLQFEPGITCVVGPNGSGKSNVADAVRWVMGEQSLKLLRGKKAQDVIFAGSDRKTRLGLAEVTLLVDNSDHSMPIDYAEVAITRRFYRDGEGEYLINKNRVRLADILLLLARSRFGQRSYSVIGQGMVDAFLLASPQERKEFFEEAAGLKQFQIKKEQALVKLEHTRDNLSQAEIVLGELRPRLKSLTRQVRRLERREEVEGKLRALQLSYYRSRFHELESASNAERAGTQALGREKAAAAQELSAIQAELEQMEREGSRESAFASLERELASLSEEKHRLARDLAVARGRQELADHETVGASLVFLKRRREELITAIAASTSDRERLSAEQQRLERLAAQERERMAVLDGELAGIEDKLVHLRSEIEAEPGQNDDAFAAELDEAAAASASLTKLLNAEDGQESIDALRPKIAALAERLEGLAKRFRSSRRGQPVKLATLQTTLTTIINRRDRHRGRLGELSSALAIAAEKQSLLAAQERRMSDELDRVKKEIAHLSGEGKSTGSDETTLGASIAELDKRIAHLRSQITGFNSAEQEKKDRVFALERTSREAQARLATLTAGENELSVKLARLETKLEDLHTEIARELPETLRNQVKEPRPKSDTRAPDYLEAEIHALKKQLEFIGGIEEGVAAEYEETRGRHDFLETQSTDLKKAVGSLERAIAELDETIKQQFAAQFDRINQEFEQYFKMLFHGGRASLELVRERLIEPVPDVGEDESENDEEENVDKPLTKQSGGSAITGIEIRATPPGKRVSALAMLSGGEKALTSIALICAMISSNPSPFVILDEVDAALDEANSIKFAGILAHLSHKTQFIAITHNRATMQHSKILYGVTMGDDSVSKILSIKLKEAEVTATRPSTSGTNQETKQ